MKKKSPKPLILNKVTIAKLSPDELRSVVGGQRAVSLSACGLEYCGSARACE